MLYYSSTSSQTVILDDWKYTLWSDFTAVMFGFFFKAQSHVFFFTLQSDLSSATVHEWMRKKTSWCCFTVVCSKNGMYPPTHTLTHVQRINLSRCRYLQLQLYSFMISGIQHTIREGRGPYIGLPHTLPVCFRLTGGQVTLCGNKNAHTANTFPLF